MLEIPISSFVKAVEAVTPSSSDTMLRASSGPRSHWDPPVQHNTREHAETFAAKFESLKDEFDLCLNCIRLMDGSGGACEEHGDGPSDGDDQ